MATSPNFSWPEPDNTDLVRNGALAIRTAVDAIDTSMAELKGGTTGQVLSKTSDTDMDFTWVAQDDANAIQNTQLTAKGALISAFSSATPATLTVGTNNQVLTADSTTATGLKWATPSGGKIVQVVSANYSTATSSTSGTFVNTGLTATITPTSASNTILVMVAQNGLYRDATSAAQCIELRLIRGSTNIAQIGTNIGYTNTALDFYFGGTSSIHYMDSPATTSATTYKTEFRLRSGTGTVTTQINSSVSTIVLMEVAA
jgi:hypothetical protein